MNDQPANSHDRSRGEQAKTGIAEKRAAKAPSAKSHVDSEPREDRDWYRVGHIAAKPSDGRLGTERTGRQRIVSCDYIALTGNEGARRIVALVGKSATPKPIVKRLNARIELRHAMAFADWRRGFNIQFFQGGGVRIVRCRRSFGFGGASSRRLNSAKTSGETAR